MGKYTVTAGQCIYDIALHLYGSIEGITDLLISNPALSLEDTLRSGQELVYSDDFEIDSDVVAWYRNNGIKPSGGEHSVYPKEFTLPLLAEIRMEASHIGAALTLAGLGELEIDWGDNSPAQHVLLSGEQSVVGHIFDNTVAAARRVRLFGDPVLQALDLTGMHPTAVFLFRRLHTERFTLENARLDLSFMSLLADVRMIDLDGTVTGSLLPLLPCKSLMSLGLNTEALNQATIDHYLIAIVEQYYGRRNCMICLLAEPSGEYREPLRDENGRYILTSGMEAVWVLTHEESWNEADVWRIVICGRIYNYQRESRIPI